MMILQAENGVMRIILITLFLFTVRLWQLNMPKKSNKPEGEIGEHVRIAVCQTLNKLLHTEESKG